MANRRLVLVLVIIAMLMSLLGEARSDTVLVHVGSKHIVNSDNEFNEFNPGVSLTKDVLYSMYTLVGAYRNSLSNTTVLLGIGWRREFGEGLYAGIDGGFATGYQYAVTPVISPFVRVGVVKVNLIPVISRASRADGVALGFSFEFNLKE